MSEKSVRFSKKLAKTWISHPWQMMLPKKFCDAHMPCHNADVILVDENEHEYRVVFLVNDHKLGRGWHDFVITHGLQVGDRLSFHLIDRCKFKVHITRTSRFAENEFQNNVPVSFVKGKDLNKRSEPPKRGRRKREDLIEENTCFGKTVAKKYLVSCVKMQDRLLSQIKKKVHEEENSKEKVFSKSPHSSTGINSSYVNSYDDDQARSVEERLPAVDANNETSLESDYDSRPQEKQPVSAEYSESALSYKAFEDFKIDVNGESLDSEIPPDVRMKYYQLCRGKKKLIHDHVVKGINSKFAVSVILEIISIANFTKTATISTAPQVLECMVKTLKSFEELGFAVGSLRAKIATLAEFLNEHQALEKKKEKLCVMFRKVARLAW